jgi:hypothetical protein
MTGETINEGIPAPQGSADVIEIPYKIASQTP